MKKLLATGIAMLALGACHSERTSENRDVGASTTRNYSVGAFSKIEVSGPYDVTINTGKDVAVAATGGATLLDETEIVVKGDTLVIRPKKKSGMHWGWKSGKATFTVSTAAIEGVSIAGSGDVRVDKASGDFDGSVAGSGSMDIAQIDGGKVELSIAGSGDIRAAGKAESTEANIAGSGDIDASGLIAKTAEVSIAGSGGVRLHATETADVSILGAGDVDITGGAKCTTSRAGSGNVTCH